MDSKDVMVILQKLKDEEKETDKTETKPNQNKGRELSVYALYKNNKVVKVGTVHDIAEHENIDVRTVYNYSTPTHHNRIKTRDAKRVVKLGEEESSLNFKLNKIEELYSIGFRFEEALKIISQEVIQIKYIIKDIPPSNNKYIGTGGKGKNFKYQEEKRVWEWLVRQAVGKDKPKTPFKKSIITLTYFFKTKHRRDPDNYSGKFILDGLVKSKVIEDDSFSCIELLVKGYHDKANPRTEITITEVKENVKSG